MFRYKYYKRRIPELDFLRGIAILLVLFSHYPVAYSFRFMWIGVDLFFVLSGFLVSGLLIREYRETGKVGIRRFLIRRGLKIYPAFYLYFFFTIAFIAAFRHYGIPLSGVEIDWKRCLAEVFYLQNYFDKVWAHHWTLAVEEHFYFLLALIFILIRAAKLSAGTLMKISLLSLPVVLVLRILYVAYGNGHPENTPVDFTHLRIDSLFAGVLLSCLYHLRFDRLNQIRPAVWTAAILFGALALVAWFLVFPPFGPVGVQYGYTVIYICFGLIVIGSVMMGRSGVGWWKRLFDRQPVVQMIAGIGVYSYSIYLWHVFLVDMIFAVVYASTGASILQPLAWRYFFPYLAVSIAVGIAASRAIEIPVLKWRDRVLPSASS
jgi:peptidoglycan/LPS O-acetylase OafA/YrhL